MMRFTYL